MYNVEILWYKKENGFHIPCKGFPIPTIYESFFPNVGDYINLKVNVYESTDKDEISQSKIEEIINRKVIGRIFFYRENGNYTLVLRIE